MSSANGVPWSAGSASVGRSFAVGGSPAGKSSESESAPPSQEDGDEHRLLGAGRGAARSPSSKSLGRRAPRAVDGEREPGRRASRKLRAVEAGAGRQRHAGLDRRQPAARLARPPRGGARRGSSRRSAAGSRASARSGSSGDDGDAAWRSAFDDQRRVGSSASSRWSASSERALREASSSAAARLRRDRRAAARTRARGRRASPASFGSLAAAARLERVRARARSCDRPAAAERGGVEPAARRPSRRRSAGRRAAARRASASHDPLARCRSPRRCARRSPAV